MSLIVISINKKKLPEHSVEEFAEWLKFKVGDTNSMSHENPLVDIDLEAKVMEIG